MSQVGYSHFVLVADGGVGCLVMAWKANLVLSVRRRIHVLVVSILIHHHCNVINLQLRQKKNISVLLKFGGDINGERCGGWS